MARSRKKLGELLLEQGSVTKDDLKTALGMSKGAGKRLGEIMIDAGMLKEEELAKALATQFGLKYADISTGSDLREKIDPSLLGSSGDEIMKKHLVLPVGKERGRLQLVIHDPKNLEMLDMLRFRLNTEIEPLVGTRGAIKGYLEVSGETNRPSMVDADESLITESIDRSIDKSVDKSIDSSIDQAAESAPIIKLVKRMIIEAVNMRASDIHIEPMADRVRLRYRIDGVCIERDNLPKRMQNAVLARFKLMSGVNIAEKRVPQDGRIKMAIPNAETGEEVVTDFRVSSCPAYHGESIVARVLRPDAVRIGLENLGFEADNMEAFNRIIRRPNGIFLVTGPTGSGKTTTLYSALDVLNRPDKKIITAEDPIEYAFTGINQCQIRESIGLTFSKVLRAMLRQAPNIILVGEIRDREVAEVAIQAALTGHLVFSTLHTNDAPSAMTRLVDMGVKPFLVASSIQAVMGQRLIRVLCKECKEPDPNPDPKFMRLTSISDQERANHTIYKAIGCDRCSGTGYRGRKAIFELMTMNAEIRDLTFRTEPVEKIRKAALRGGMRSLLGDGKLKILNGVTTPAEIARVAQVEGTAMGEELEEEALT